MSTGLGSGLVSVLQWGSDKYKCSGMERLAAEQNCEVGARVGVAVRVWVRVGTKDRIMVGAPGRITVGARVGVS